MSALDTLRRRAAVVADRELAGGINLDRVIREHQEAAEATTDPVEQLAHVELAAIAGLRRSHEQALARAYRDALRRCEAVAAGRLR